MKNINKFLVVIVFVFIITFGFIGSITTLAVDPLMVCTQEAKQCPDGSYVSRTGPNCEFASCSSLVPIPNPTPMGCSGGNLYNTSTGQLCTNTVVASYNFGSTTLGLGSRGNAVMELQKFLNQVLNLSLVIDGKLGPKTIAVIKQWQRDNGLVADGLVGNKTKTRMNIEMGIAQ